MDPTVAIRRALFASVRRLAPWVRPEECFFERPSAPEHGDYSTNVAFRIAPKLKRPPIGLAEKLARDLGDSPLFLRVEAVSPGFLNVFLAPEVLRRSIKRILEEKNRFGRIPLGGRKRVQLEFISANPTGPLTLGNGRGGFFGDALSNILEAADYRVTREYYINDAGAQMEKLGWSLLAALFEKKSISRPLPVARDVLYRGSYIASYAERIGERFRADLASEDLPHLSRAFAKEGAKLALKDIQRVVRKLKIHLDSWFSEQSLHRRGIVQDTLRALKRRKLTEEREGALWLRAQELGESKDRVLVKSSGEPTYLLPDLAYHKDKFSNRNFSWVIDIVGADHHGHMMALRAGLRALRLPEPTIVLIQLVRLVSGGKEVRMSKRRGTFVMLEELVDEVGLDSARFFFLQHSPGVHMDFDLDLAKEQSERNPVYYVQYAHARIASILRKASKQGSKKAPSLNLLIHPSEIALTKQLIHLPELVGHIARTLEVHQLTTYALNLARSFHAFYRDCRVISEDEALTGARLALCRATQVVLRNTLSFMGIRAPERM